MSLSSKCCSLLASFALVACGSDGGDGGSSMPAVPGFAYVVANGAGGGIHQFTIGTDGTLTEVAPAVAPGTGATSLMVDPSRRRAYAPDFGAGNVLQFGIRGDGTLLAMVPATAPAGVNPIAVAVDPSGRFAYAANGNSVSQYTVGANGALASMTPPSVTLTGGGGRAVTVDPSGRFVHVADFGGN